MTPETTTELVDYLTPIFDDMPSAVARTAILAGGAIRAYYDGTPVKDYNLFFRSKEDFVAAVQAFKSFGYGIADDGAEDALCRRFTDNESGRLFNLIGAYFGEPCEIVKQFDFRCCQHYAVWGEISGRPFAYSFEGAQHDARHKLLNLVNHGRLGAMGKREKHYVEDYGYTSNVSGSDRHQCEFFPSPSVFPAGNSG